MSSNDAIYIRSQSATRCLNFPITLTKHLLYDGPFFILWRSMLGLLHSDATRFWKSWVPR
ncbi:hypothetical protein NC653_023070 [Populus alba x Populus x berolinensis]|uniref:Uncharacterized protein n=1 Tax=Populus alba x Populus x berolinensis TaxID=444605 RepID=A0AAD6MGL3_9ROSI|nr:hypothetical protein NC653_023070 [Populus alba x Populus x berolinensis]